MQFRLILLAILLLVPGTAYSQQVVAPCTTVSNPFGGAANCVPVSITAPLPTKSN